MRRLNLWMLAAILTICGTMTMGLTSCSDVDDPVTNTGITEADMKQASIGLRLDLTDIVLGTDRVRIWDFKEDNKFVAYDLYTDDEENFAVEQLSGTWKPFVNQNLAWDIDENIQASGIKVIFDDENGGPGNAAGEETYFGFNIPDENNKVEDADLYFLSQYALSYLAYNESVSEHPELYEADENDVDNVGDDFDPYLARKRAASASDFDPTKNETVKLLGNVSNNVTLTQQALTTKEGQQQLHQTVMNTISNQTKGTVNYNPNDATFNLKTWRDQTTIQLWDGQKHITVQLPWSTQVTNNNLPMNFCDDIIPSRGWDLVMNYCGEPLQSIGSSGYHFFAVYNKYTGTLRFFTYIPENFDANHANDHAWEVIMGEQTALHLGYRYGLPLDKTVVNRAAIGMNSSEYNVYCSPWVDARSKDGYVTPNAGWWAFDVDLPAYRPGYTAALQRIRLQMRAWANSSVTLSSKLSAKIQETVDAQPYNFSSLDGVKKLVTDLGGNIGKIVSGNAQGKTGDMVSGGFGLLGAAVNIGVSIYKSGEKPVVNVLNTIDGTIDTKGLISGTVNVSRVTSPDMPMTRFDTKNTTLGQGVWNIKSSPVVYQLDAIWDLQWHTETGPGVAATFLPDLKTFGIDKQEQIKGTICLFDPSSVEVVLNPNVFADASIEKIDVQTICAVRKDTKFNTGEEYRKAFGLPIYNQWSTSKDAIKYDYNYTRYDLFDYLNGSSETAGLTFPTSYKEWAKDDNITYALVGRGDDHAIMEPGLFSYRNRGWNTNMKPYLPSYEVTVQLAIKLKDQDNPLIYTRTFLPEVRWLNFNQAKSVVNNAEEWLAKLKKDSKVSSTEYQEHQVKHLKEVISFIKPNYDAATGVTYTANNSSAGNISALFDGNLKTDYESTIRNRITRGGKDQWDIGVKASRPIKLKSYTIYNSYNWYALKSEPTLWSLRAKDSNGKWIEIDSRSNEQPKGPSASKTYTVKVPGTYQEIALVVVNYNGSYSNLSNFFGSLFGGPGNSLRIGELVFHEE